MKNISFVVTAPDGSSTTVAVPQEDALHYLEGILRQLDPKDLLAVINAAAQVLGTKLPEDSDLDSDSDTHVRPD